jgi:hypothetical protein
MSMPGLSPYRVPSILMVTAPASRKVVTAIASPTRIYRRAINHIRRYDSIAPWQSRPVLSMHTVPIGSAGVRFHQVLTRVEPVLDRSTSVTVEWPQPRRTELLYDYCSLHSNKSRQKLLTNPEKSFQQHSAISKQLDVSRSTGILRS